MQFNKLLFDEYGGDMDSGLNQAPYVSTHSHLQDT